MRGAALAAATHHRHSDARQHKQRRDPNNAKIRNAVETENPFTRSRRAVWVGARCRRPYVNTAARRAYRSPDACVKAGEHGADLPAKHICGARKGRRHEESDAK